MEEELAAKKAELNQARAAQERSRYQGNGTQTQVAILEASQYEGEIDEGQARSLRQLREKTHQVEEISLKIDELLQVNASIESLLAKAPRYNQQLARDT